MRGQDQLGVRYTSDATDTTWFDAEMRAIQAKIDQRISGVINLLDVAECGCSRWILVSSYSDRQTPIYALYDRNTEQIDLIGQARPKIDRAV